MKPVFLLCLVATVYGIPRPQDNGVDLSLIGEIFGSAPGAQQSPNVQRQLDDGYSGENNANSDSAVDVLVQIVKDPIASELPDDYSEPINNNEVDRATVEARPGPCSDYERDGYECVPYYQCNNGEIITDGAGLIDIRNGFGALNAEDAKCPGFLDVCCKDPDHVAKPREPIHEPRCGRRNAQGLQTRITGFHERESQFGEWPHMVAILSVDNSTGTNINLFQCGGSLIAPGVVLTAAHCVDTFRNTAVSLKVRAGEWDTQTENEPYIHQDRNIVNIEVHPEYFAGALFNDVALLYTDQIFNLAPHVDTICLPYPGENFDYENCFATGWGKDKFGVDGEYQVVLKEVVLPTVTYDECQTALQKTRLGSRFKLHSSFICAGGADKDTCKGDGGGPMVCPSKTDINSYVQAGIVAWGIGCGENGTPGVYASVSEAVCWIDYSMSIYYGALSQPNDYSSYWGLDQGLNNCYTWMQNKLAELKIKSDGAPDSPVGREAKKVQDYYTQYNVYNIPGWDNNYGEEVELTDFERAGSPPKKESTTSGSAIRFGK